MKRILTPDPVFPNFHLSTTFATFLTPKLCFKGGQNLVVMVPPLVHSWEVELFFFNWIKHHLISEFCWPFPYFFMCFIFSFLNTRFLHPPHPQQNSLVEYSFLIASFSPIMGLLVLRRFFKRRDLSLLSNLSHPNATEDQEARRKP